jgi:hypothetical protein
MESKPNTIGGSYIYSTPSIEWMSAPTNDVPLLADPVMKMQRPATFLANSDIFT